MGRYRALAVALVFAITCMPVVAQDVARAAWAEGDTWTYRHVARLGGHAEHTRTYRVTGKQSDRYEVEYARSDRPEPVKTFYTLDMNQLVEGAEKSPNERKTYEWPLSPGRTWSFQFTEASVNYPGRTYMYRLNARVEAREEVNVPAGKFNALRIRVEGNYTRSNDNRSARVAYTVWYAPEVKRSVKTHFTSDQFTSNRGWDDNVMELTAYRIVQ